MKEREITESMGIWEGKEIPHSEIWLPVRNFNPTDVIIIAPKRSLSFPSDTPTSILINNKLLPEKAPDSVPQEPLRPVWPPILHSPSEGTNNTEKQTEIYSMWPHKKGPGAPVSPSLEY